MNYRSALGLGWNTSVYEYPKMCLEVLLCLFRPYFKILNNSKRKYNWNKINSIYFDQIKTIFKSWASRRWGQHSAVDLKLCIEKCWSFHHSKRHALCLSSWKHWHFVRGIHEDFPVLRIKVTVSSITTLFSQFTDNDWNFHYKILRKIHSYFLK